MNLDEMLNIVEKNDPDDVNLYMVHNINSKKVGKHKGMDKRR